MIKNDILQVFISIILVGVIIWTIKTYKKIIRHRKRPVRQQITYMVEALKLYDEETYEHEISGRKTTEKRVIRSIDIRYCEDERLINVRIYKYGDRFQKIASELGANLESALGLELEKTYSTVDYFEYVFPKIPNKRITLTSGFASQGSDYIKITENIGYELSKTPHSLIVGGTGSGKSFFIFGKIVSYLRLTPKANLIIVDPKKSDLSLLRFVKGFEGNVATEPSHICRLLRKTVEIMEERYSQHFNDVSSFGKTYKDFGLPVVILIFDEFSAFMHSVDKKLAKEALDYVFTLVMKGRQAGCMVEILMQRPSADDLPTNIRSQMGFKAGLGNMDGIGYNMIFDTNDIEYKTISEKGGGYIQVDGVHLNPVYFETPHIPKDYDFIAEIEKLMAK